MSTAIIYAPLSHGRAVVDDYTASVRDRLTCRGVGCFGCCHGPILLSPAEWGAIKPHVTRAQRNAARIVAGVLADYRCPLLGADNRCSAYEDRPLVCRSFNSTASPTRCYPGQSGRAAPEAGSRAALREAHDAMGVRFGDCMELAGQMAAMTDAELAK